MMSSFELQAGRPDAAGRFSRYLAHLKKLTDSEPLIREVAAGDGGPGPRCGRVLAIGCLDVPEPGYVTGFTYGLSLAEHAEWTSASPELCMTIRSADPEWVLVSARAVDALRGVSSFGKGRVLGYKEPFTVGTEMPSLLRGRMSVPLGEDPETGSDVVDLVGAFSVHASGREFVKKKGFGTFWSLEWDRFDPTRCRSPEEGIDSRRKCVCG